MRNRFVCVGTLLECAIQYYATHAKIRMALDKVGIVLKDSKDGTTWELKK